MARLIVGHGRGRPRQDDGFTLIEVVVALFLLGMVATAVLLFYVRGVQATSHLQRSQSADSVAMEAMEKLQGVNAQGRTALGVSALLGGRYSGDVTAASTAFSSDAAGSVPASDPAASPGSVGAAVPITASVLRGGTAYTVTTLIGTCYRAKSLTGADQTCVGVDPGSSVQEFRATVIVTWKPTVAGQCGGAALCSYRISALVDPSADVSWNLTARPVAYDDQISLIASGAPATAKYEIVKTNDIIGSVTSNPVIIVTPPAGTASIIASGPEMGMLQYAPPAGFSGTTTMVYKLRDAAGRTSNEANVVITVKPKAAPDSFSVYKGASTVVNILANDLGTFTAGSLISTTAGPAIGTLNVSGTTVTYNAPSSGTSATFKYTVTDASGLASDEVAVTLTLLNPAPVASDLAITLVAVKSPTPTDLGILLATGNDSTNKVVVVSGPTDASGWGNIGPLAGSGTATVTYTPGASTVGIYTLTYYVQNPAGNKSPTKTTTITVVPVATTDSLSVQTKESGTVNLAINDIPTSGMTYTLTGIPDCGWTKNGSVDPKGSSATLSPDGSLVFAAPKSVPTAGICTVPYTISRTVGASTVSVDAIMSVHVTDQGNQGNQ